jgi:outer membrane protein, multidrug efflux system
MFDRTIQEIFSRRGSGETNAKSEYRNPKQTSRQKSHIRKFKTRIRMKVVWNFTYFGPLRLFGISDFVLRIFALGELSVLLLAASSCSLSTPPTQMEVIEQALPKGTRIPPQWVSDPAASIVADDWLKSFNDPALDAIVAEAIANNLDLRQGAARVEAARQIVVVVGSRLWPQIGAQFSAATLHDSSESANTNSNMQYGGISWEIDLWGRIRAQKAAAEAGFEATALDYAFARQSVAATTAKSWYLAIETRQLLALAEHAVEIFARLLELVKIRRAAGKVADLDVAEASANLNTAESDLRLAQGLYSEARRALELLLGRYPAAEIEISAAFAPLPPPVAAGLPSSLLERRPDIIAAERQVLAAFRSEEAAKLALLPAISLNFEGGRLSDRILDLAHLNPALYRATIGMSVPIFTGGALTAQIKIATAEEERTVARYGSVVLRAFGEVEVALTNETLLTQRTLFDQRALNDRNTAVQIAAIKYNAGSIDLLSVLILQNAQLTTQGSVIKLRNAQLANRINLHLALGGSFDANPAASP